MPTNTERAAERLRAERDRVIAEWQHRARAALPAARREEPIALVDSMPSILDRIAEAVATGDVRDLSLAQEHGKERAERGEFTLAEVLGEYQLLEQVLHEVLGEGGASAAYQALRRAINACMIASAAEFDAVHTSSLSRDQQLYRHLVEGVHDYAIFSLDSVGVVTTWNHGAARMNLYSAEEIIGTHFSTLYPEDARERDEPMEHLRMADARGRYRGEGWRVKKGGDRFLADVLITPMYVGGRLDGYSKVVADLTERSRIVQERELSRSRILAAEAEQKARDEQVSRLSHDVRSPLQAAKLGAELLRRRQGDAETFDRLVVRVVGNLARVDEMITQLLDLNRLRAGELPAIHPEECALDRVVQSALEELSTVHGDRFELDVKSTIVGQWDPDAIRRIVENLCGNAVKYGSRAHPITVVLTRTTNEAQIAVHNHGEPIPPDERERLFDQFARMPSSTHGATKGWGIGLAVVKALTEAHGGRVRVDSDAREGTTFKIDLPLRPARPAPPE